MSLASFHPERRSIALIGSDSASLASIEAPGKAAGRIVSRTLLSDDLPAADRYADIIVLDVSGTAQFDQVAAVAGQLPRSAQIVVRASLDRVDMIDAACPDTDIVIGSDPVELHLALASALAATQGVKPGWSDVATDEGMRLQRLADEIARIARTLVELPEGLSGSGLAGRPGRGGDDGEEAEAMSQSPVTSAEVRAIIRLRRLRDRFFDADLFADPAWDMLLDLAAARLERVRVAVSSLCIAAAVPPTTALRWIKAMTDKGLLRRVADPHDARRIFIQLSDDAAAAMDKYLRAVRGGGAI